jgi:hypothetical protein
MLKFIDFSVPKGGGAGGFKQSFKRCAADSRGCSKNIHDATRNCFSTPTTTTQRTRV